MFSGVGLLPCLFDIGQVHDKAERRRVKKKENDRRACFKIFRVYFIWAEYMARIKVSDCKKGEMRHRHV